MLLKLFFFVRLLLPKMVSYRAAFISKIIWVAKENVSYHFDVIPCLGKVISSTVKVCM